MQEVDGSSPLFSTLKDRKQRLRLRYYLLILPFYFFTFLPFYFFTFQKFFDILTQAKL